MTQLLYVSVTKAKFRHKSWPNLVLLIALKARSNGHPIH
ncbi:hypothetical protein J2782_003863 [Brucella pseudogrignonensis]|uniref:Transposase n=1 Tax=Brucella pseudogrignonensis TaxID=419475 RepID=A0ABU1MDJ5_9HYPH|nr:hypothetical protein [Brucella pseudogrignonensis]